MSEWTPFHRRTHWTDRYAGALKATGNRGLQPAMDHVIENEGKPVPDMQGVSESKGPAPMDVDDEDEDAKMAADLAAVEAKVILHFIDLSLILNASLSEYQMLRMWQSLQEHGAGQLSRREEWSSIL